MDGPLLNVEFVAVYIPKSYASVNTQNAACKDSTQRRDFHLSRKEKACWQKPREIQIWEIVPKIIEIFSLKVQYSKSINNIF